MRAELLDVVLAATANALNQGARVIMPIAIVPAGDELGWTTMQRGWVLSAFAYGYIIVQLPSGWVATHVKPTFVLSWAVLAWSLCTALTPWAARLSLHALFALLAGLGLAEGFCLPAVFQILGTRVAARKRSRAFALVFAAGGAGQLVALLSAPLLGAWSVPFFCFGAAGVLWCALAAAVECARREPSSLANDDSDQLDDERAALRGREASPADIDSPGPAAVAKETTNAAAAPPPPPSVLPSVALLGRLCSSTPLLAICSAHFGQNWTNFVLASWLPTYLHTALGLPVRDLWLTALPFLVNALAGLGIGHAADLLVRSRRLSVLNVRRIATAVGLLGPALCHVMLVCVRVPRLAIAAAALSHALGAATSAGYMANHADISHSLAGLTFSWSNTLATVPGLVGGPFTAHLLDATGGAWASVFFLAAGINSACAMCYLVFARADRVL